MKLAITGATGFVGGHLLDQAGDVGNDEFTALVTDHAQLWAKGGEGIGADLGLGICDGVDEGRLSGVGKADQPDVGEQLEAQPDVHLFSRPAGTVLARRPVGRGLVTGVAAPAVAALEEVDALPVDREVGEQRALLVVGEDLRSDGDLDDQVLAARAGHVAARAALAARGAEVLGVAEVDQRVEAGHRFEHDVAALAAFAAVGAAIFDELLPPEADGTGAARAGLDEDLGLVEKMHGGAFSDKCGERAAG